MTRRRLITTLAILFLGGIIVGRQTAEVEPQYKIVEREVVKTKTVTKYETEQAPIPEACFLAMSSSADLREAVADIDRASAAILDILSEVRLIAASGDYNAANDTETELRQIRSQITDSIAVQVDTGAAFDRAYAQCTKELE